jgi:hypothetical protein
MEPILAAGWRYFATNYRRALFQHHKVHTRFSHSVQHNNKPICYSFTQRYFYLHVSMHIMSDLVYACQRISLRYMCGYIFTNTTGVLYGLVTYVKSEYDTDWGTGKRAVHASCYRNARGCPFLDLWLQGNACTFWLRLKPWTGAFQTEGFLVCLV